MLLISKAVLGQDYHFTQYESMPMALNPALTGDCSGTHSVGIIHREQASAFTNGYITTGAYYNGKFLMQKGGRLSFLGLGADFLSDYAGDARMGVSQFGLSVAYFMELMKHHIFSIGFKGSYGNRKVDFTGLRWGSQYIGNYYDEDMPGEIMVSKQKYSFVDVATGISWHYVKSKFLKTQLGLSLYHVNNVKIYSDVMPDVLDKRFAIHGNLLYMTKNEVFTVIPSFMYEHQGPFDEVIFGSMVKFQTDINSSSKLSENYFSIGLFQRWNDSFIITTFLGFKGTRIGISYDINTSYLSLASKGKGAMELSIQYYIPYERRKKYNTLL